MFGKYFKFTVISFAIIALVIFPGNSMNAAKNALETCFNILLPSLFPFFVFSRLFILSGGPDILNKFFSPVIRFLFGISGNGATPFILGIISGYPVGAQSVCELYENKLITKSEAENLLCFCNNSGPLFLIGAVGIGMFQNRETGIILYISHIISAIMVGIILKKITLISHTNSSIEKTPSKNENIFTQSVEKSVTTILSIFGYVIFFAVVMDILNSIGIITTLSSFLGFLNIPTDVINACICSILEITTGIKKLSECCDYPLSILIVLCSAIASWGGISVHAQVKSIISKTNLSFRKYLFGKVLHSVISFISTGLILTAFPNAIPTFSDEYNVSVISPDTIPFFAVITFLIVFAYIVKKLSVKPPYRRGKHSRKYRPQCVNSK